MQYENNKETKKQRKQNVLFHTTSAASNLCVSFIVNMILRRTDFGVYNAIVTSIMLLTAPAREDFCLQTLISNIYLALYLTMFIYWTS